MARRGYLSNTNTKSQIQTDRTKSINAVNFNSAEKLPVTSGAVAGLVRSWAEDLHNNGG